ncbi:DUF3310 domain-containing protein [Parapusillimonas sp. JC17]|uniref:DUF3310 domain-containing protein n=1 Tax=Parapusillimonas sp. JC17 TaxID=3445768 RepID=UPI003F9F6F97
MTHDGVERPAHYTHAENGIECIDAIRAALGREGFIAFLRGQVIRYQWRLGHKDSAAQDAGKARWYAAKLERVLKEGGAQAARKQPETRMRSEKEGGAQGGWNEWAGGPSPVAHDALVDLQLRSGAQLVNCLAMKRSWGWKRSWDDIVAYRLSKQPTYSPDII